MRPRQIAYIIWTVIALLGVISWVVPDGGWHIGKHTLRWPTLAEALDLTNEGVKDLTSDSLLAEIDTIGLIPADSVIQQDTLAVKDSVAQKSQPIIPKVNVANTDSRAYLAAFYAALDSASSQSVRVGSVWCKGMRPTPPPPYAFCQRSRSTLVIRSSSICESP